MSGRDDFNWDDVADDVVIPQQYEIAVYNNPDGGIVCRQRQWPDEDSWIFFHPSHALALAKAILAKAGLDMEIVPLTSLLVQNREGVLLRPFPNQDVIDKLKQVENAGRAAQLNDDQDEDPVERKREKAAERQRRRREKQRQRDNHAAETEIGVTERDRVSTVPAELDLHGGESTALTH